MKNLFDLGYDIWTTRGLLSRLTEISSDVSFHVLPNPMQQKVEKLTQSLTENHTSLLERWGPDVTLLDDFHKYMEIHLKYSDDVFIKGTEGLLAGYSKRRPDDDLVRPKRKKIT